LSRKPAGKFPRCFVESDNHFCQQLVANPPQRRLVTLESCSMQQESDNRQQLLGGY
jgi:hypothetical protein